MAVIFVMAMTEPTQSMQLHPEDTILCRIGAGAAAGPSLSHGKHGVAVV